MPGRWRVWIDRGGTFTDVVGLDPSGRLHTVKVLSCDARYPDAAVEGVRRLLGVAADEPVPVDRLSQVRLGTTVATNALLTRTGARTVLVTTAGFADALRIGDQSRPRLFDRHIVRADLLHERVIEAVERIGADGTVVRPLDGAALGAALSRAVADGIEACAIAFVHGHRFPAHEAAAAAIARAAGFAQVSVSHEVSPLPRFVPRAETTVVDAYLSPVLQRYVAAVVAAFPGVPVEFLQSNGGLAPAASFRGRDAVLSGPAGGVVAMARLAAAAGYRRAVGFDMGGTSTDVSHWAGELERAPETTVAGVRVRVPMVAVHTVAAGGGSVVTFDGARVRVGPDSAGADPGPACYGRGGPPTVTDANVVLGRIDPAWFPAVFGPDGDAPIDATASIAAFEQLAVAVSAATGVAHSAEEVAAGAVEIAVATMANALKRISVARGHDLQAAVLQCFGGAGGQHATAVADAVGIDEVLVHPLASVLSAYGIGLADRTSLTEAALDVPLDPDGLARAAVAARGLEAAAGPVARYVHRLHVRYAGTDTTVAVPWSPPSGHDVRAEFEDRYRRRFSFLHPDRGIVIESVSLEAIEPGAASAEPSGPNPSPIPVRPDGRASLVIDGVRRSVPRHDRARLRPGAGIVGPAIVVAADSTTVVEPGWSASVTADGSLCLQRTAPRPLRAEDERLDPVRLELFDNLFMAIAQQMGERLQATASSVNIAERLDFSCAVFDADGSLVANAPHMPVHLGSMGESVRAVIADIGDDVRSGDAWVVNDPYRGGTHLPDVTVVSPVVLDAGPGASARPMAWVASRGHHGDIGGLTPGSMPPRSRTLADEGVLFDVVPLVRGGILDEVPVRERLRRGPYPSRDPERNLADLRAQVAANTKGVEELGVAVARHGRAAVRAYLGYVQDQAADAVRRRLGTLSGGRCRLETDDGDVIAVAVTVDAAAGRAVIDFAGTSPQSPGNANAPRAITRAAVLYVLRTLLDDDLSLNDGCLRPVSIVLPPGSLVDPAPPAAVVAGNVETSMVVTNALHLALGTLASSQCTMNNLTFGDATMQYYETIAGGSGAGNGFAGTDAVQTHMTNSRLTDVEILEQRYPVRVERFAIRRGSGGRGRWRGGDGVVRRIRFLAPMTVAILSNGRRVPAPGLAGGASGALGRTVIERVDGSVEELSWRDERTVAAGDVVEVATPGGGGFGEAR